VAISSTERRSETTKASELFEQVADVIVSAAGSSDFGTFTAAAQYSAEAEAQVWAVGLDNDQWFAVPANQQSVILTSIIKRVDIGAYRLIEHMLAGEPPGEAFRLGVADDAYDISTQGDGLTAEMTNTLQEIRMEIADGLIDVPTASQ
jgi:basic membrane protein A